MRNLHQYLKYWLAVCVYFHTTHTYNKRITIMISTCKGEDEWSAIKNFNNCLSQPINYSEIMPWKLKFQQLSITVQWIWGWVFLIGYPHFCLGMPSCLDFIWFDTVDSVDISPYLVKWGYEATLQLAAGVPLQLSGSILCQDRWWSVIKNLTQRGTYPFHTLMVLQPWLSSMSSCGRHSVCCPIASIGWRWLSLHQMHVILQTSTSTTCYLKSSPILSGCSGGHPWEKS